MKSKKMFLLFLIIFVLFPTPILADDDNPRSTIKTERREARETIFQERQEIRTTIKQERQTLWTEFKKKQINLSVARIQTELKLRYDIIQKLKSKIANRITQKSVEFDTSSASAKLAQFSDAQYQTDLAGLNTKIAALTASDTPRSLMPGVRAAADVVRKDLRNMHLFLVEVMKLVATSPKR